METEGRRLEELGRPDKLLVVDGVEELIMQTVSYSKQTENLTKSQRCEQKRIKNDHAWQSWSPGLGCFAVGTVALSLITLTVIEADEEKRK